MELISIFSEEGTEFVTRSNYIDFITFGIHDTYTEGPHDDPKFICEICLSVHLINGLIIPSTQAIEAIPCEWISAFNIELAKTYHIEPSLITASGEHKIINIQALRVNKDNLFKAQGPIVIEIEHSYSTMGGEELESMWTVSSMSKRWRTKRRVATEPGAVDYIPEIFSGLAKNEIY